MQSGCSRIVMEVISTFEIRNAASIHDASSQLQAVACVMEVLSHCTHIIGQFRHVSIRHGVRRRYVKRQGEFKR